MTGSPLPDAREAHRRRDRPLDDGLVVMMPPGPAVLDLPHEPGRRKDPLPHPAATGPRILPPQRLGDRAPEASTQPLAERFDDAPEAEWGPVEVLAHVAEMIPFWQGEMERIIVGVAGGAAEPIPFGRVATDTVRLAVLERDRTLPWAR